MPNRLPVSFFAAEDDQTWAFFLYISTISGVSAAANVAANMMNWFGGWAGRAEAEELEEQAIKTTRVAWAMIPFNAKNLQDSTPIWYSLRASDGSGVDPFSVLVSITCKPAKGIGERPSRLQYDLHRCVSAESSEALRAHWTFWYQFCSRARIRST